MRETSIDRRLPVSPAHWPATAGPSGRNDDCAVRDTPRAIDTGDPELSGPEDEVPTGLADAGRGRDLRPYVENGRPGIVD